MGSCATQQMLSICHYVTLEWSIVYEWPLLLQNQVFEVIYLHGRQRCTFARTSFGTNFEQTRIFIDKTRISITGRIIQIHCQFIIGKINCQFPLSVPTKRNFPSIQIAFFSTFNFVRTPHQKTKAYHFLCNWASTLYIKETV